MSCARAPTRVGCASGRGARAYGRPRAHQMATRLGSKVRYPDGVCRALVAPDRISEITLQSARHVYPAGCGATGESERATNEVGIWSRSQAEITSVPMLGLLSSLCTVVPNDGAGDHAVAIQYASEGARALLFSTMARVHAAFADLFSHLANRPYEEGYGALGRDNGGWGWCMHELAWRQISGSSTTLDT